MDIAAMLRHHEGLTFEAKEAAAGMPRSVWETYAAFANTVGGVIVLGVHEGPDGALIPVGVPDPDTLVKEFWNTVNNPTKVSANILTHANVTVMQMEGASLVVITVPRAGMGQRPVYLNGRLDCAFRRRGEGDYRCTEAEARAMMRDSAPGGVDITVLEQLSLDALAPESIEHYRRMLELAR